LQVCATSWKTIRFQWLWNLGTDLTESIPILR
jgi:hypothetical protein